MSQRRRRLTITATVGAIVLSAALAGCSHDVTIDQSSPERLVYTMLLANANGQDQDVKAVMTANGTTNPWAVADPSEITYCNDDGVTCDYYPTQSLSDGSCPSVTSDVEAVESQIVVEYTHGSDVYGDDMRAAVTVSDSCSFDTFNVDGSWVVIQG